MGKKCSLSTLIGALVASNYILVMSHEEPGAAGHNSVERNVLFDRILSAIRTESYSLEFMFYSLEIVFI